MTEMQTEWFPGFAPEDDDERCVVCGTTDIAGRSESILHEIRWAVCSEHVAEGYEHAVAEHQPCDC